jgi:hypothetical protein
MQLKLMRLCKNGANLGQFISVICNEWVLALIKNT